MSKFLIIHPSLEAFGGSERVFHYVLKTLLAHDQKVELLTPKFDERTYEKIMGEEFPKGVSVHFWRETKSVKPPFVIYKRFFSARKLLKEYKTSLECDYIFLTQGSNPHEAAVPDKAKKIAYVHFPEIHYSYAHSGLKRKMYLLAIRRVVGKGVKNLNAIFANSQFTKEIIKEVWGKLGIPEPIVVYPPVDLKEFWCDKALEERKKQIVYIGRFVPAKRHNLMKELASEFPQYEFVSVGGLDESMKEWFQQFSENLPKNYVLMPNLPHENLKYTLCNSRICVHLYEGEHFGIAPIEALASGCIVFPHDSGGIREFIPGEFRWSDLDDLKTKITHFMETDSDKLKWAERRAAMWKSISMLNPERFQKEMWKHIKAIIGR